MGPPGKIDTISYPDSSTTTYTYDSRDNLIQMQDSTGTTSYTYDEISRLTGMTDPNNFNISYTYNEVGNLATLTYPGNKTVTYTYDDLNRIETVTDWLDRTATYNYDDAGRLISLTQFNGTVVVYTYDNASRLTDLENLTAQGAGAIAAYHFTLDDNGNRIDVDQEVPIAIDLSALSMGFTTNNTKNRLLSAGSDSFTYDDEGQLQSAYGNTLSFDPKHRLTQISGTVNSQYQYDGSGNRLEAIRNGVTTQYIYGASGNLLAEADANGDIQQYYIYGAGLLAMATSDNSLYSYHFNATGHTVAMTDINKTIVNKYTYSPFGTIGDQEEAVAQPFKFVGQFGVMTEANGWYYMRARYYDPAVGRFISEDPLGFDGGDVNLYGYVLNNPINKIDPLGLFVFGIFGGGSAGGGVAGEGSVSAIIDHTGDGAVSIDISTTFGPQVSLDKSAGFIVAPFAKTSDLAGPSKRINLGFGLFGITIAVPKNPWHTSVSIDVIPGLDFGFGKGLGYTWTPGANESCK